MTTQLSALALCLMLGTGCANTTAQPANSERGTTFSASTVAETDDPKPTQDPKNLPTENKIQVAILLDVSSSMDGLINQAKSELWGVVNEIAKARKNGLEADLEIALYDYGKSTHAQDNDYVRKILDFTGDLDTLSEVLFALNTNGGDEYCGSVINKSINELAWQNLNNYDVIFIAGNEPFDQGKTSYKTACKKAKEKNIFINTIHCGDEGTGIIEHWKDGANLGGGEYFFINSNTVEAFVPSPYDADIEKLNTQLNETYWGYGAKGKDYKSNQAMQDVNNEGLSKKAYYDRATSKISSKKYEKTSAKWDATSRAKEDKDYLEKAGEEELPEQLKNKTVAQKKQIVGDNTTKRDSIAKELQRVSDLRNNYLAEQRKKESLINKNKDNSLGRAMAMAIRKQAGLKGFVWEK